VLVWIYKAGLESSSVQATVGKLALGIKITSMSGRRIGFWHATGRLAAELLSVFTFWIGFLFAAFTKRRQALHDLIARTLVVERRRTPDEIVNAPPASGGDGVAAIAIVILAVAVVGIMAAIAIPAYQDYTIRTQVTEGLVIAAPYKAAVASAAVAGTEWDSMTLAGLNLSPPSDAKYVADVDIVSGAIGITYGKSANTAIRDKALALVPYRPAGSTEVRWICGRAPVPAGASAAVTGGASYTTIPDKYLPMACRQ
jgi:Tfp pilus assembly major pilin PilA